MQKAQWVVAVVAVLVIGNIALAEGLSVEREQQIIRDVLSIYQPTSDLAAAEAAPGSGKCAFGVILEAKNNWSKLSKSAQDLLAEYVLERPEREFHYDTPEGHFRIHYDTSGSHSVDLSKGWSEGPERIPYYVIRVGEIFEEVWQKEIEEMGYPAPPSDAPYGGETDAVDIFVRNLGRIYYGLTTPEYSFGTSPPRATAYMEIDNDYRDYEPLYSPEEWEMILSVTVAHEFFHVIQVGMDVSEYFATEEDLETGQDNDIWWHEMTATWMEDIVYGEVNDYYNYLPGFFNNPAWALTTDNTVFQRTNYEYGACVWPRYLSERFGNDIIREVWVECAKHRLLNVVPVLADELQERGASLYEELGRFRLWCYYSGDRYRTFSFEEGLYYPTIDDTKYLFEYTSYPVEDSVPLFSAGTSSRLAPYYLGATYISFVTPEADSTIDFKFRLTHEDLDIWAIVAAGMTQLGEPDIFSTRSITEPLVVPKWQTYENIMVMAMPYDRDYVLYRNLPQQKFSFEVSDTLQSIAGDEVKPAYPNPFTVGDDALLTVPVYRESKEETEVTIYTAAGELVRGGRTERDVGGTTPYYYEQGSGPPHRDFQWDGRNRSGEAVASGIYICLVRLGDDVSRQTIAVFRP